MDLNFLTRIIEKLGFSLKFIDNINTLYKNIKSKFIINGILTEEIQPKRGVRQGCPMSMYLYILYIEPFLKEIKSNIQPTCILKSQYTLTGFVDDVAVFIQSETDFYKLDEIVKKFEKATNSKVNRQKTQTLTIGEWKNKTDWTLEWINPQNKVKILGKEWYQTTKDTIRNNCDRILTKINKSIENTFNRNLTLYQKATFFNSFIVPQIEYIAKILPIPKSTSFLIQNMGYKFLWKNHLESLALNELFHTRKEGGLNITNVQIKTTTLLTKTFLEEMYSEENNNKKILQYWTGINLRNIFPTNNKGPNCENPPEFLKSIVKTIKFLNNHININPSLITKQIYVILLSQIKQTPKIITKNPNTNFKPIFQSINKPFLSNQIKEHMFKQIHNILPTKDRIRKCLRLIDVQCDNCNQEENLKHLFKCKKTEPATKFIMRRIENLYKDQYSPRIKDILLFNFPKPEKSRNMAIWLSANFSLILWKKRKKQILWNTLLIQSKVKKIN